MPRAHWLPIAGCVLLLATTVGAVDHSKFRTCEQGSFCRRYRHYVSHVERDASVFAHALDARSIQHKSHVVAAKVSHVKDALVTPLLLELRFFRDAVEDRCGIVRLFITEATPLHPRFQLREGDVVTKEAELTPDEVTISTDPGAATTVVTSTAPGGCSVTLRHAPLELEFAAGGKVLQRINGRHLLNFEQYRPKDGRQHAGLVDATSLPEGSRDLWEEGFGGHSDSKPRGPAAVGVDVSFLSAPDVMGLAEHSTGLGLGANKISEPYRFYNLDVFEYELDSPMGLYGAIPFVTAIHQWQDGSAPTASGFLFVNPSEGHVKVDAPATSSWSSASGDTKTWWLFESGVMDIFLFAGPTPQAVTQQYHTVTGWPRMPPIATLGKHQSRWNYVDVDDSVGINKKFDQHDIPYDVLWLDIEHTDAKKYFTWHPTHFGKPDVLLDALAASKRKLVTIVDPHIKKESGYNVYETMKNKDMYTKTKSGSQYDGWCWPGTSYYPDFCNPEVRNQWAKFFALDFYPHNRPDLYTWNDMNEPSVFNGPEVTMPRDNLHKCHTDGYAVEHRDVHNVYGFYHHGATVQGQLERAPNVRPFVLTRSFFVGSHRHGAMWTGDNMARWNHMARSVPMLVSLCLCGMSFAGADVPGFFYDPDINLFKRWHQLGIWYPFYRGHAHLETKRREPWTFGDEVTNMLRDQITARYQLLPTWYTLFAEWALLGLPIMRPPWYHDLTDLEAYKHANDHFLVGEAILVRAVTESGSSKVDTYFPGVAGGEWFDYWDLKAAPVPAGKVKSIALNPGHVPAYVRKGHIIFKKMRRRRSTGAMTADPYSIFVFGPEARGRLYIDDGNSHNFQGGEFLWEEFSFDGAALKEQAAPVKPLQAALPKAGGAKGLPSGTENRLRVERIVFVGLPRQPTGARLLHSASGASDALQVTAELSATGSSWVATVKKPTCILGSQWSLELDF